MKENADTMSTNERAMAESTIDDKQSKLKRRLLSTIRFIGELFKENLLKPTIMYECIDNLIAVTDADGAFKAFKDTQDEQYIELLCRLLHTIGAKLESQETSSTSTPLKFYFRELEKLSKDKKLNSRIRFSLEEVIELRRNHWQSRREEEGPAKLDQIHEKAAAEELAKKQWSESGGNQQYGGQHTRFGNQSQDNNRGSGGQQDARGPRNQGGQGQGGDRNNFNQQRGDSQGQGQGQNYQGDARDQRGFENRSGKGQGQGHNNSQEQNRGQQQQQQQRSQQPQQQQQQQQQQSRGQYNGNGGNNSPSPSSSSQSQQTSSKSPTLSEEQIIERVNSAVGEYCHNKNPTETIQTLTELPQTAAGFVILNVTIIISSSFSY